MMSLALTGNVPLARRQLLAKRGRLVAGVAGIGVALLLVLALNAIFAGLEGRLTAYIDRSGADVIVAQEGVQTMHMTQSALPLRDVGAVADVSGIAAAEPILYKSAFIERGGQTGVVAVVGGGPVPGRIARPGRGEIVVDQALADRLGLARGDRVRVLGASLHVVGEVKGTASIAGSFAFVNRQTLAQILHAEGVASYVLVRARAGVDAQALARAIERRVPGVTASTRQQFAASERRVVGDMSTDIVRGMTLVGFVVGIAVAGLVAYSLTLSQLRDWGVLRAIGLGARRALALVIAQVGALVISGFALALALVFALAAVAPSLSPTLVLTVGAGDVVRAAGVAGAVALVAALIPVVRVARLEPASVYRRSS
jgi:putative ABC transport system permease protein